ncbi:MAG: DUF3362 domain-containing protein, partial [Pontibacterium sp.]
GCEDEDMVRLAQWLKSNDFEVDQVQTFYPSPMSLATAMYHSDRNPLKRLSYKSDKIYTAKTKEQRQTHKALMRFHDPENWPMLRRSLTNMGLSNLIGVGPNKLVPAENDESEGKRKRPAQKARGGQWSGKQSDGDKRPNKRSKPASKSGAGNAKPSRSNATKASAGNKAEPSRGQSPKKKSTRAGTSKKRTHN